MGTSDYNISTAELICIFDNALDRSAFIWDYQGFKTDGNNEFYIAFIGKYIDGSKSEALEDAIELSIALDYFKLPHLHVIEKHLLSNLDDDAKLLCLDWLRYFFKHIPKNDFERLNRHALQHNKSDLLKVQAILNLLMVKNDEQLITVLKKVIAKTLLPAVFYRVINMFDIELEDIKELVRMDIKVIIENSIVLTKPQKDILTARILRGLV
ncbi:hypothetical protein SNE26_27265 [Mucilaginibacter sp. cycad4]|uniref:hypothetical protein n=1 Tax=Mucilaginibacter sp. cycad4 TaxID=3342096 RepID=UPI002AAC1115|nr:hypothetical protein [Mucilaginibacter gossypii]WPU99717.1 hypothetical protein SNE26_27265 [Mucilaginibacter gossypii]